MARLAAAACIASGLSLSLLLPGAAAQGSLQLGGGEQQLGGGEAMRRPVPDYLPDPTTDALYECIDSDEYSWDAGYTVGSVTGQIYWPEICGVEGPADQHPVVLLIHGDGHMYTDYAYLMEHLAANGFIVATINGGSIVSNVNRALKIRTYLDFIFDHWEYSSAAQNNIGLIGHSRGGEAILTAARKFGWLLGDWAADGRNINGLISLTPSDSDANGGTEGHEDLSGDGCRALLVITGSRDEDVYGNCLSGTSNGCNQNPTAPQETGFALYDRAGSEWSTEGTYFFWSPMTKSHLAFDFGTHNGYRSGPGICNDGGFIPELTCQTHRFIARGYMNAWMRWHLNGEDAYEPFFTGEAMPGVVSQIDDVFVRTQYSTAWGRRVIDNFEQGGWQNGAQSSVTKESQVTVHGEFDLWSVGNLSSPHDTRGLSLSWSGHPLLLDPWIRWTIPDDEPAFVGRLRDVTEFEYLSFRVGLLYGALANDPGDSLDFAVRLIDSNGSWSPKVRVSSYTDVRYPDDGTIVPVQQSATIAETAKSSMQTVRMPLEAFVGVDLENVQHIHFQFDDDDLDGEILMDSLEFHR